MIALSTAWRPRGAETVSETLRAGRKAGFASFEIGVSRARLDLDAVIRAVERDGLVISSVHSVCSEGDVPPSNSRGDWIGEADEERRREGVRYLRRTIDAARALSARVVVVHGGVLPMPDARDLQARLFREADRGLTRTELASFHADFREQRRRVAAPFLDALGRSLREACDFAPDVILGLENRYYISELPGPDEFEGLFDRVGAPNLRYWHDTGHAHILDRIGFLSHVDLLDRHGPRLAGVHLHDVRGFDDHRPPGTGDFNFGALAEYLRPDVLRVMEVASGFSPRDLRRGREHLAEMYGIH